ncbi:MAG: four helix bundle protein [Gemmatimonadaceae bacterium]
MGDFKKLKVWGKAHALALNVHRVTARIRGSQHAGLRNQMIRAAMSIPANVVEGNGQRSSADYNRFVGFALNSSSELEYHLMMARDIRLITARDFASLSAQTIEVRKMLHGLSRYLTTRSKDSANTGTTKTRERITAE